MTYLNEEQVKLLLRPIHPRRVLQRDGMSYVEGYDIRAELNRAFGFGRWSAEVLDQAVICENPVKTKTYTNPKTGEVKGGKDAWYVVYRTRLRLTVHAPDGTELAFYDGSHVGESTHPVLGDAHGNALTNSETYALRRCAINLGDQFGLSLYNKGSLDAIVRWTLVKPEAGTEAAGTTDTDDVPQVSAEDSGSSSAPETESAAEAFENAGPVEVAHAPRDASEPEVADEARAIRAGATQQEVPAVDQWLAATLRVIPQVGMEACRKLWPEVTAKFRAGEIAEADSVKVLDLLKARMKALKNPPQGAAPVADALDPADPWALKIEEIVDGDLPGGAGVA